MGTSISHRSPSTPNWGAAAAGYICAEIGVDRVVQEVWRAAINQPSGNLGIDLSAPIVSQCLQIAVHASTAHEASEETTRAIAFSGQASVAADLAHRAVVSTSRATGERVSAFVCALFSGATEYLVSRDLPGYVGFGERLKNVSDALAFKSHVRRHVESIVKAIPKPEGLDKDPGVWQTHVKNVLSSLTEGT